MTEHTAWQSIIAFVKENEHLTEIIVFFLGFAESLVLVSFFVPASILFLAVAALHSAGDGPFIPILLAGALGCLVGDLVSYMVGWRMRHQVKTIWPFPSASGPVCTNQIAHSPSRHLRNRHVEIHRTAAPDHTALRWGCRYAVVQLCRRECRVVNVVGAGLSRASVLRAPVVFVRPRNRAATSRSISGNWQSSFLLYRGYVVRVARTLAFLRRCRAKAVQWSGEGTCPLGVLPVCYCHG